MRGFINYDIRNGPNKLSIDCIEEFKKRKLVNDIDADSLINNIDKDFGSRQQVTDIVSEILTD